MRRLLWVVVVVALVLLLHTPLVFSSEHPKVKIRIITTPMGTGAYFLGFKLAEIVNKNHPWLQLEAIEGMGSATNVQMVMRDPSMKKTTIINSTNLSADFARQALPPFTKPYKEVMGTDLQVAFRCSAALRSSWSSGRWDSHSGTCT